jgi:hypothetical protein
VSELAFFDTKLLVYTDDAAAPAKREEAIAFFRDHLCRRTAVLSLQVLAGVLPSHDAEELVSF